MQLTDEIIEGMSRKMKERGSFGGWQICRWLDEFNIAYDNNDYIRLCNQLKKDNKIRFDKKKRVWIWIG